MPSSAVATEKIESLVKETVSGAGDRFVAVRQPISVLFRDKQRYLIGMLNQMRMVEGSAGLDSLVRLAESDPAGRTGLAAGVPASKQRKRTGWRAGHIARALTFYSDEDRRSLVGTDLTNGPDSEYARWCHLGYDRAEAAGEPVVEDIRALIFRSHGPPLETRYRRLLVPLTGAGGESFILCTTDLKLPQAA